MVLLRLTISSVFVLVYACRSDLQTIQAPFYLLPNMPHSIVAINNIQIVVTALKVLGCHQFHCEVRASLLATAWSVCSAQLQCLAFLMSQTAVGQTSSLTTCEVMILLGKPKAHPDCSRVGSRST